MSGDTVHAAGALAILAIVGLILLRKAFGSVNISVGMK